MANPALMRIGLNIVRSQNGRTLEFMTEANRVEETPVGSPGWRENETRHTIRIMEELCGYRTPTSVFLGQAHHFGKGHYVFTKEMPEFIWRINFLHKPTTLFPHCDVMHRWYLLNSLLVLEDQPIPGNVKALYHDPGYYIAENRHLLATMLGFALLEELSFRLTRKWNDHGVVQELINNPRLKNEKGEQRHYKPGARITDFQHKLILMEEALPSNMQLFLADMNKKLEGWGSIDGISQQPRDLYTRLFDQRNKLVHGVSSDGWEGWLITLLVNCIYLSFDQNFQETGQSNVPA
jgi:hypothetical protein